jgi:hypothetical protein
MRAIQLNATYEPLSIISWEKAFIKTFELKDKYGNYLWEPKAEILYTYPNRTIHGVTHEWPMPAIIILKKPIKRKKLSRLVNPSKVSILTRDLYTCQYCGKKLSKNSGTRDHVYPECKGGKATWDNLVACCKACQEKKADRTCEESDMWPTRTPREPTIFERFRNGIRVANATERRTWLIGLKKLDLEHIMKENKKDGTD